MGQKKSRHSTPSAIEQAALRRITSATSFLPDEIQYFYYDFLKYSSTGYLVLADFEKFYQTLFVSGAPETFAKYAFDAYDVNRDGKVDFEEFIIGLYYTTKATPVEKIRWAFDLCDRDKDQQLDVVEMENVIRALYDLSDVDMTRVETYEEAIARVKELCLSSSDDIAGNELLLSVSKTDFVDIVQKDTTIMKLIDSRTLISKRASKFDQSSMNLFRKHSKSRASLRKSLSDSRLAAADEND